MKSSRRKAILYALLAAVFYALNMPVSKELLKQIPPTFMASLLYLGAGFGVGVIFLLTRKDVRKEDKLAKEDLPYTVGMILLDILAPILLMMGLTTASAESASLLNNFEIVATSLIALLLFREAISKRLWAGIALITVSSILLSVEDLSGLAFSKGSLLVLAATCCWGLENNCTRQISEKNTYQIVMIKGIFSGLGSFLVALLKKESFPGGIAVIYALLLGFVAYGLSIFFYIRAQKDIGAAKTSAYYAVAPFAGALLAHFIQHEELSKNYGIALLLMIIGSAVVVADTLIVQHCHLHTHTITHTHDGSTHTHTFTHEHDHVHMLHDDHGHTHTPEEIRKALGH